MRRSWSQGGAVWWKTASNLWRRGVVEEVANFGGVWRLPRWRKGGQRRRGGVDQQRRCGAAEAEHGDGVRAQEVRRAGSACGDQAVCAVETAVLELKVA